ncbi:MAG: DUF222 domain-containing protein [Trueperaceae bacterium]|nr:DUF222 domain-containing protein [Trueperaceae bacterium]
MTTTPAVDSDDPQVPEPVRTAIADAVTADTGRQDLLVEYARALGPDPTMAGLDDDELEQAVRIGAAEIAAATCRWLQLLAELVVRGVWADHGARTPASWLSWALGVAPSTAREHVRVALRLRECPLTRERMAAGRLSYSKVRAITRVATPETEQLLLQWADAAPAHVLERIITDARRQQRAGSAPEDRDDLGVTRRWREDGTFELVLRVDAGTGIAIEQDLDRLVELDQDAPGTGEDVPSDAETTEPPSDEPTTSENRRVPRTRREADLIVGAVAAAVQAGPEDASGADRHHIVLHTTPTELLRAASDADVDDGDQTPADSGTASAEAASTRRSHLHLVRDGRGRVRSMSARTLWRLACSARFDLAIDDENGHPADLGRARRAPDARLRRLLLARDRTCRFPGCGATRFLHAHHVVHWENGGATDLDNLVLLCNHHHTVVHKGWDLRPAGTGRWTFHAPSGPNHHRSEPHPWARRLPGASAEALREAARAHANDLAPEARARLLQPPHWDGGDYDHSMTVGLLVERLAAAA